MIGEFWIGVLVGAVSVGVFGFVFLLWALYKAYNMGYDDAEKGKDKS